VKRLVFTLVVVFVLLIAGFQAQPSKADGSYIRFTSIGGGVCQPTYVSVPVSYAAHLLTPLSYTTVVRLNGVSFGSNTGTDSAGDYVGTANYGTSFPSAQSFPYTYQWSTAYPEFGFTINAVCQSAGAAPVVSIASTEPSGPTVPSSFVLRTITCTVPVYDSPAGRPVGDNAVTAGQTWFVSPSPVKGSDGKSWTEIFVGGFVDGFIPTACVG